MRRGASPLVLALFLLASCGEGELDSSAELETDPADPGAAIEAPADPQDPGAELLNPEGTASLTDEQFDPKIASRIHMRVLHEADGKPVHQCPINVFWERGGAVAGRVTVFTDAEGRAHVNLMHRTYVQKIIARGTGPTAPEILMVDEILGTEDLGPYELRVRAAARFAGRVVDVYGEPVPFAEVRAFVEDRWALEGLIEMEPTAFASTDSEGRFRLGGMPGGRYLLTAVAQDRIAVQRAIGTNEFDEEIGGIELIMAPAHSLSGQVVDDTGQGVAGAVVEIGAPRRRVEHTTTEDPRLVYIPARQWVAETDLDGGFAIPAVPIAEGWVARVLHNSFREFRDRLQPGSRLAELQLERGLEVHMLLQDVNGRPIPNGDVVLLGASARAVQVRAGRALLEGLDEDPDAVILVSCPGLAMRAVWPVTYNTAQQPLELVLEPALPIEGRVVDANGDPLVGVRISAEGLDFLEEELWASYPGRRPEDVFRLSEQYSDEDGRFRFGRLYAGRWQLIATTQDGREQSQEVQAGTSDLRIIF